MPNNCSAEKIKVDWTKNRYYTKGNFVIEKNRKSSKKTKVAKFQRQSGLFYHVNGKGVMGTTPMKNFKKKSTKK